MPTNKNPKRKKSNVEKSQDDLIQSRLKSLTWFSSSRERQYQEDSQARAHALLAESAT